MGDEVDAISHHGVRVRAVRVTNGVASHLTVSTGSRARPAAGVLRTIGGGSQRGGTCSRHSVELFAGPCVSTRCAAKSQN